MVGVYVEPGLSYYFDDGTDMKTIYKDKPLNLNLNHGRALMSHGVCLYVAKDWKQPLHQAG